MDEKKESKERCSAARSRQCEQWEVGKKSEGRNNENAADRSLMFQPSREKGKGGMPKKGGGKEKDENGTDRSQ